MEHEVEEQLGVGALGRLFLMREGRGLFLLSEERGLFFISTVALYLVEHEQGPMVALGEGAVSNEWGTPVPGGA